MIESEDFYVHKAMEYWEGKCRAMRQEVHDAISIVGEGMTFGIWVRHYDQAVSQAMAFDQMGGCIYDAKHHCVKFDGGGKILFMQLDDPTKFHSIQVNAAAIMDFLGDITERELTMILCRVRPQKWQNLLITNGIRRNIKQL